MIFRPGFDLAPSIRMITTMHEKPSIQPLSIDEAEALLVRNCVGRIAYSLHDRVDIEAIHYVYDAPWVFARTSVGSKVLTLAHNRWCAFEVDEARGLFDWQSVVVKGPFMPFDPAVNPEDYVRALAALRRLIPGTLTDEDPSPHRDIVFGVHATDILGRCSVSNGTQRWSGVASR
jgi:nitroimidazol reductase NimA-like FMN-containing flavoprotein (pyridoxamine 5'-phosphate oxidase superfamily)